MLTPENSGLDFCWSPKHLMWRSASLMKLLSPRTSTFLYMLLITRSQRMSFAQSWQLSLSERAKHAWSLELSVRCEKPLGSNARCKVYHPEFNSKARKGNTERQERWRCLLFQFKRSLDTNENYLGGSPRLSRPFPWQLQVYCQLKAWKVPQRLSYHAFWGSN